MKEVIMNFISNRTNLTLMQYLLYFIIGYIMSDHLTLIQISTIAVLLAGIQLITRTKAVADGMLFRQIMLDNKVEANDIVKKMKEMQKEIDSKDSFKN